MVEVPRLQMISFPYENLEVETNYEWLKFITLPSLLESRINVVSYLNIGRTLHRKCLKFMYCQSIQLETRKPICVKRPYKQGLKQLIDKQDVYLLYWWEYDSKKFEVYGSIEQTTLKERNIHRLPKNGLSELLEKPSDEIDLYGTLLIVKYDSKSTSQCN